MALYATPTLDTVVAVVGALAAGVPIVTISTHSGQRELEHIVGDSAPEAVLAAAETELPPTLQALPRVSPVGAGAPYRDLAADDPERTALVIYTSGTTGLPKGVEIPRRAIATNLDALADAWAWTDEDVLVHALPLFHAHGLVLGTLGPLRLGGRLVHVGRFEPGDLAGALRTEDDDVRRSHDVQPPGGRVCDGHRTSLPPSPAPGCSCPARPPSRPSSTRGSRASRGS